MAVESALIFLAPLVKKAVDSFLSTEVPEQVNKRIQSKVQEIVQNKVESLLDGLNHTKNVYVSLALCSIILTIVGFYSRNEVLGHGVYLLLYAIPLFMSLRSLRNLYLSLSAVLQLEENIKVQINQSLNEAELSKKLLFKFYERRSVDDLAKFTAGTIVFELIKKVTHNKKTILKSVVSYLVSFFNLLIIRYFL